MKQKGLFYGWIIVIATLLIVTYMFGARYAFGVFFKPLESDFQQSRAAISLVLSISMAAHGITGFLGGWASDKYGPKVMVIIASVIGGLGVLLSSQVSNIWQLYIFFGLLLGIGSGLSYTPLMATIPRWFVKKRGLALGIATAGVGLGGVALPPLAAHLIPSFGWHTAFLILGLIGLAVCMPCSWLIKRDPQEMGISPLGGEGTAPGNKSEGATGLSLGEALRTRTMWLIYLILFFYLLSYFTIIGHLVRHMEDMNIAPMSSSLVLSFIGGFGIIGRIGMGSIAEKIRPKLSLGIIALVMGLMMLWLIWSGKLWMFYLFGIIYGFFYGGITPLLIMAIAEFFGLRYLGALSGTTAIAVAVGAVAGPIIAGHIFDITQSYNLAFLITAIGLFLATLCALFLKSEVKEPGSCS